MKSKLSQTLDIIDECRERGFNRPSDDLWHQLHTAIDQEKADLEQTGQALQNKFKQPDLKII